MGVVKCFDLPNRKITNGDLGIEIEVEGVNLPHRIGKYWGVEYDGSLQGEAYEYVLSKPLKSAGVSDAMAYLKRSFDETNATINDSVRCGVHVHVNVQKLSIPELYNFITLYSLFEGVLLDFCGVGRDGNLFCLPLNKSPLLIRALRNCANGNDFGELYSDEYRYCAMNVKSLWQYGSLEFRALRGGPNLNKVERWAMFLLHLRELACSFENPVQLVECASMLGYKGFFDECVGGYEDLFTNCVNVSKKLKQGARGAFPIAFSRVWDEPKEEIDPYEDFC